MVRSQVAVKEDLPLAVCKLLHTHTPADSRQVLYGRESGNIQVQGKV
jgi:hypothetical protein